MPSSSASNEERRDDLRELTIDCAFEVDMTLSFSLLDNFTGQGSFATSMRLIFHASFPYPVRWTNRFALR
jgi:hypothetical protein